MGEQQACLRPAFSKRSGEVIGVWKNTIQKVSVFVKTTVGGYDMKVWIKIKQFTKGLNCYSCTGFDVIILGSNTCFKIV